MSEGRVLRGYPIASTYYTMLWYYSVCVRVIPGDSEQCVRDALETLRKFVLVAFPVQYAILGKVHRRRCTQKDIHELLLLRNARIDFGEACDATDLLGRTMLDRLMRRFAAKNDPYDFALESRVDDMDCPLDRWVVGKEVARSKVGGRLVVHRLIPTGCYDYVTFDASYPTDVRQLLEKMRCAKCRERLDLPCEMRHHWARVIVMESGKGKAQVSIVVTTICSQCHRVPRDDAPEYFIPRAAMIEFIGTCDLDVTKARPKMPDLAVFKGCCHPVCDSTANCVRCDDCNVAFACPDHAYKQYHDCANLKKYGAAGLVYNSLAEDRPPI
jgi:hypothetical protein